MITCHLISQQFQGFHSLQIFLYIDEVWILWWDIINDSQLVVSKICVEHTHSSVFDGLQWNLVHMIGIKCRCSQCNNIIWCKHAVHFAFYRVMCLRICVCVRVCVEQTSSLVFDGLQWNLVHMINIKCRCSWCNKIFCANMQPSFAIYRVICPWIYVGACAEQTY